MSIILDCDLGKFKRFACLDGRNTARGEAHSP